MKQESIERLDALLAEAAAQLFSSHGVGLGRADPAAGGAGASRETAVEAAFSAAIGFTAPALRGALVLSLDSPLVRESLPPNLKGPGLSDATLADWTGELANQLLGRLKGKLVAYGVEIALGTPVVFAGREMRHYCRKPALSRRLAFRAEGATAAGGSGAAGASGFAGAASCAGAGLRLELEADLEGELELGEPSAASADALDEGEAMFF